MGDNDRFTGSQVITRLAEMRGRAGPAARRVLLVLVTAGADAAEARCRFAGLGADLVWSKPLPSEAEMADSLHSKLDERARDAVGGEA